MKRVGIGLVLAIVALGAIACKETVTGPNENFEYFVQGAAKIQNEATLIEKYQFVIVDNISQQSAMGITSSGGWTEEFRWNSDPTSLWVSGKAMLGTYGSVDVKSVTPTCVDHPQWSKAKLCRFTIEIPRQ